MSPAQSQTPWERCGKGGCIAQTKVFPRRARNKQDEPTIGSALFAFRRRNGTGDGPASVLKH
ncbi:hypothetical protein C7399_13273 [Paraburkholderia tropica]|uniref:Uncharacterized protein n=1 Tax=Paraburkholderia tropica TaxID=92647 RepID=A0ABX5MDV8_9BURK|nr:hypothetical protein C7400_13273 [Paraburkholderia tropica]PZW72531.1 hypothetical protein C7399_13273 [Paraburkholderia tropica]